MSLYKRIPLIAKLIIAVTLGIVLGSTLSTSIIRVFVTFSSIFSSFLGFTIPLIIVGFIVPGISQVSNNAGKLLGLSTGVAYISTIIAGTFAFLTAEAVLPNILANATLQSFKNPEDLFEKFPNGFIIKQRRLFKEGDKSYSLELKMKGDKDTKKIEGKVKKVLLESKPYKETIEKLLKVGIEVKSHLSVIETEDADKIRKSSGNESKKHDTKIVKAQRHEAKAGETGASIPKKDSPPSPYTAYIFLLYLKK